MDPLNVTGKHSPPSTSLCYHQLQHFFHREDGAIPTMNSALLRARPCELDGSKGWVVGAIIFQEPISEISPKLLLLKRASHETAFPNLWELPGGGIEIHDETVAHAVAREVLEETSLVVHDIIAEIKPMTWESKTRTNIRLNYVVNVQPMVMVKLNPDEHSNWVWAEEGDVEALEMTLEMREVVQNAFAFAQNGIRSHPVSN